MDQESALITKGCMYSWENGWIWMDLDGFGWIWMDLGSFFASKYREHQWELNGDLPGMFRPIFRIDV